jgi:hypothetical protein
MKSSDNLCTPCIFKTPSIYFRFSKTRNVPGVMDHKINLCAKRNYQLVYTCYEIRVSQFITQTVFKEMPQEPDF